MVPPTDIVIVSNSISVRGDGRRYNKIKSSTAPAESTTTTMRTSNIDKILQESTTIKSRVDTKTEQLKMSTLQDIMPIKTSTQREGESFSFTVLPRLKVQVTDTNSINYRDKFNQTFTNKPFQTKLENTLSEEGNSSPNESERSGDGSELKDLDFDNLGVSSTSKESTNTLNPQFIGSPNFLDSANEISSNKSLFESGGSSDSLPPESRGTSDSLPSESGGTSDSLPPESGGTSDSLTPESGGSSDDPLPRKSGGSSDSLPPESGGSSDDPLPHKSGGSSDSLPPESGGTSDSLPSESGGSSDSLPPESGRSSDSLTPESGGSSDDPLPRKSGGSSVSLPPESGGSSDPLPPEFSGSSDPLPPESGGPSGSKSLFFYDDIDPEEYEDLFGEESRINLVKQSSELEKDETTQTDSSVYVNSETTSLTPKGLFKLTNYTFISK